MNTKGEIHITDNLDLLLQVLPDEVRRAVERRGGKEQLLELVLDLGRQPEARYMEETVFVTEELVSHTDLHYVTSRVGEFGKDNRAGIERTLHRISAIRNRGGRVVGLTCRVGRAVFGTIDIMRDEVLEGRSILILGRPGVGKTTKLREVARVLSEEAGKRVIIVDTSNEIAGDGDIPHPAIGRARRMQVPEPSMQHAIMIEAVENHMPEVIIIDEIGTEQEAFAARTIAERGVQLVGTAHGNTLENLLMNPTLSDLIGGIQPVTLSDEEARRRGTQKTVLERKAPPTFDVVIEMIAKEKMAIHPDVAVTVDNLLRGRAPRPEIRERSETGVFRVLQEAETDRPAVIPARPAMPPEGADRPPRTNGGLRGEHSPVERPPGAHPLSAAPVSPPSSIVRLFPYGVSRNRLEKAIRDLRVPAELTRTWDSADAVVALKAHTRREPGKLQAAMNQRKATFVVRSNTQVQIESLLREIFGLDRLDPGTATALEEVEMALRRLDETSEPIELSPQVAAVRRLQHQVVQQYPVVSTSIGEEPYRRLRISRS